MHMYFKKVYTLHFMHTFLSYINLYDLMFVWYISQEYVKHFALVKYKCKWKITKRIITRQIHSVNQILQ